MIPTLKFGRTGVALPVIGLGCSGISHAYGQANEDESFATLRTALDLGVTMLDTSDSYGHGHNETIIGHFIREVGRDRVVVATKVGDVRGLPGFSKPVENRPEHILKACDASLKRLGVDCIDIYYLHRRDRSVPLADSVGALAQLVEAGKVRWIGLSEVNSKTLREANAIHPVTALQSEYSLWTRDPEDGVLDVCRELRITFVPFSPLGRAFLTGTIDAAKLPTDDFRAALPRFQGEAASKNMNLVHRLARFAAQRKLTPAQVALAWLLAKNDGVTTVLPIPGTKRPKYVAENVAATAIKFSAVEVAEISDMFSRNAVEGARYTGVAAQMIEN
jgi:aryl-alcohol dehydrogenase-like predicted oxidoreductase